MMRSAVLLGYMTSGSLAVRLDEDTAPQQKTKGRGALEHHHSKEMQLLDSSKVFSQVSGFAAKGAAVVAEGHCAEWPSPAAKKAGFLCNIEAPEQELVKKWVPANATVMEF